MSLACIANDGQVASKTRIEARTVCLSVPNSSIHEANPIHRLAAGIRKPNTVLRIQTQHNIVAFTANNNSTRTDARAESQRIDAFVSTDSVMAVPDTVKIDIVTHAPAERVVTRTTV